MSAVGLSGKVLLPTLALGLMLLAPPALAASAPDPHIRYVDFDKDKVVHLTGYTGFQIMVEFGADERIETVGAGDATGWQVTPNGAASLLFLKPVIAGRTTNLAIVTNRRRYNLELTARPARRGDLARIVYALRYRYAPDADPAGGNPVPPPPPPLSPVPPDQWNRAYSFEGARDNVPEEVFDDGHATYLRFGDRQTIPAIFALADSSGEAVVNTARRDGFVVIDQIAPVFVLRQGPNVTRLYNDGYTPPAPGPQAPRERVDGHHRKERKP